MAMTHILLTLAYEGTALVRAMPVWALLVICVDVDGEMHTEKVGLNDEKF